MTENEMMSMHVPASPDSAAHIGARRRVMTVGAMPAREAALLAVVMAGAGCIIGLLSQTLAGRRRGGRALL